MGFLDFLKKAKDRALGEVREFFDRDDQQPQPRPTPQPTPAPKPSQPAPIPKEQQAPSVLTQLKSAGRKLAEANRIDLTPEAEKMLRERVGVRQEVTSGLKGTHELIQEINRSVPAIGGTAYNLLGGEQTEVTPSTKVGRFLFGDRPIKTYKGARQELKQTVRTGGEAVGLKLPEPAVEGIAASGFALGTIGNFFGGGSGKRVGKEVAESALQKSISKETASYLDDLIKEQDAVRRAGEPGVKENISKMYQGFIEGISESDQPIYKAITDAEKRTGNRLVGINDPRNQLARTKRVADLSKSFMDDNGLSRLVQEVPDQKQFEQYLTAVHNQDVVAAGKPGILNRNLEADQRLIAELGPTYEPYAKELYQYGDALLQRATEAGLISAERATELRKLYPRYVPLYRVMNEVEDVLEPAFKRKPGLTKLKGIQKFGDGSELPADGVFGNYVRKTINVIREAETNRLHQLITDANTIENFDNPFGARVLRSAENVEERSGAYKELAETKPLRDKLEQIVRTNGRQVRRLQNEINQLERKGYQTALKEGRAKGAPETPKILRGGTKFTSETKLETGYVVPEGKKGPLIPTTEQKTTVTAKDFGKQDNQALRKFLTGLIEDADSSAKIKHYKKMVAKRDADLLPLLDRLQKASNAFKAVKASRKEAFMRALAARDEEIKGAKNIPVWRNGTKEVWEVDADVARVLKEMNKVQNGLIESILAIPTTALRLGATGVNIVFAATNLARDQVTAFINTDKAWKTSILGNPANFLAALTAALKHDDLYREWVRAGASGTSADILRQPVYQTVESLRADRSLAAKAAYTLKHPGQILRMVEDLVATTETSTRIQVYRGTKEALVKAGMDEINAAAMAAAAARTSTVDFLRAGRFGRVLNLVIPYLNAGIQGSRQFITVAKERPKATALKVAATTIIPTTALTLWYMSDPRYEEIERDLQGYEKDRYFIIPTPWTKKSDTEQGRWEGLIKVPISQQTIGIVRMTRRILEGMRGQDPYKFGEFANDFLQTVTSLDVGNKNALISQVTPQLIKPVVEGTTNTNLFTGKPIVPESMQDLPIERQYQPYTSGTIRLVGARLGISPLILENSLKTMFGGSGQDLLNVVDHLAAMADVIPEDQIGGRGIGTGISRAFTSARGGALQDEKFEVLREETATSQVANLEVKDRAIALYDEIIDLPTDQRNQILRDMANSGQLDEATYKEYKKYRDAKLQGVTSFEKALRGQSTDVRARVIWREIGSKPVEERNKILAEYEEKGILTEAVYEKYRKIRDEATKGR